MSNFVSSTSQLLYTWGWFPPTLIFLLLSSLSLWFIFTFPCKMPNVSLVSLNHELSLSSGCIFINSTIWFPMMQTYPPTPWTLIFSWGTLGSLHYCNFFTTSLHLTSFPMTIILLKQSSIIAIPLSLKVLELKRGI